MMYFKKMKLKGVISNSPIIQIWYIELFSNIYCLTYSNSKDNNTNSHSYVYFFHCIIIIVVYKNQVNCVHTFYKIKQKTVANGLFSNLFYTEFYT